MDTIKKEKDKAKGEGKGDYKKPARRIIIPFYGGRNTSPLFEEAGRLEELIHEKNITILQINICGKKIKLYHSGKIPETCIGHKLQVYQEISGNEYCLQVYDTSDKEIYPGKTKVLNKVTRVRKH